jgi:hypothetical protein
MINYSQSPKSIVLYEFSEKSIWGEYGEELMFCTYGSLDAPETMPDGYCSNYLAPSCFYREYC